MTESDLIAQRLRNQKLTFTTYRQPEQVVSWLGAVQSQDYGGAKWAVALRTSDAAGPSGTTEAAIDRACDEGRILRTHILRPTWHFVAPADIRWMLMLTAPRVHGFSAYYYRKHELTDKLFARCHKVLARALEGGKHLTRTELQAALRKARIESDNLRLGLIVMQAELSALICSGARRGKQFTYALLEERVPPARGLTRDEALAELTRRYIASHGPVTLRDYSWWSGLSMRDAKRGIELIASDLEQQALDECTYWSIALHDSHAGAPQSGTLRPAAQRPAHVSGPRAAATPPVRAWLLPNYDEYFIAYKDRETLLRDVPKASVADLRSERRPEFAHLLTIDGRLAGSWQRTVMARAASVEVRTFRALTKRERGAVDEAIDRYAAFLEVPVKLSYTAA